MIQLILTIIEDLAMAIFISKYTYVHKKTFFIFLLTSVCVIETSISKFNSFTLLIFPIIMFITTLLCLKFINKEIKLNDIIASLLAPSLILVTDLLALIIWSLVLSIDLFEVINNDKFFLLASIFAKFLLIIIFYIIIFISKNLNKILCYKKWGILFPIWVILFILFYYLAYTILYGNFDIKTIYFITISLIILSILLLFLVYKIQKNNEISKELELESQRIYYIKKNIDTTKKINNEIALLQHSSIYNLLHTKIFLLNKNYDELEKFIDKQIDDFKKIKHILTSGNPLFDYEINKHINKLLLYNPNIKVSGSFNNQIYYIDEVYLNNLVKLLNYLFKISNLNEIFNINIYQDALFLKVQVMFIQNKNLKTESDISKIIFIDTSNFIIESKNINEYTIYTIIIELR